MQPRLASRSCLKEQSAPIFRPVEVHNCSAIASTDLEINVETHQARAIGVVEGTSFLREEAPAVRKKERKGARRHHATTFDRSVAVRFEGADRSGH